MSQQVFEKVSIHTIDEASEGQRVDNYLLSKLKGVPKSHIYRIIRRGEVRINKKRVKAPTRLLCGDELRIPPIRVAESNKPVIKSKTLDFIRESIVSETDDYLVINKPHGLAVHGGSGVSLGVIELLRAAFDNDNLELVHRLDRDTSGCLLIAKRKSFLRKAHTLFRDKQVKKHYLALLVGRWQGPKQKIVKSALQKNRLSSGERMVATSDDGKASQTMFQLVENFDNCCLVSAYPKTGRTHQIRVHAEELGQPIVGDKKYGYKLPAYLAQQLSMSRMFLHAKSLSFKLDEPFFIEVLPDKSWQQAIDSLKQQ